jgi:hypothetical protein
MSSESILTKEAALFISLGLTDNYILQVLTLRSVSQKEVHLVLYDGAVYFGAIYEFSQPPSNAFPATQKIRDGLQGSTTVDFSKESQEERWRRSVPKQMDVIRITSFMSPYNSLMYSSLYSVAFENFRSSIAQSNVFLEMSPSRLKCTCVGKDSFLWRASLRWKRSLWGNRIKRLSKTKMKL